MGIAYATREDVMSALAFNETAQLAASVDRACQSASRSVDALCHRVFFPTIDSRTFRRVNGRRLWLDQNDIISVTSITVDGDVVPAADYDLYPDTGPPFTSIDFPDGPIVSGESELVLVGLFGFRDDTAPAGALESAISSTSATTLDVTDGSLIGVGDVLVIDTERLQVTGRTWLTSAQTGSLAASAAAVTLSVATGSAFRVGEPLLIGAERLTVVDIAGNDLTVKRAQDGSVLAAHTTATIYTSRTLTVVRGVLGTTAATHLDAAVITKQEYPSLVRSYAIALACNQVMQEGGAYSRDLGTGDAKAPAVGGGLDAIRRDLRAAHGRQARQRSV